MFTWAYTKHPFEFRNGMTDIKNETTDELLALKGIYSDEGEVQITRNGVSLDGEDDLERFRSAAPGDLIEVKVRLSFPKQHSTPLIAEVKFILTHEYPSKPPSRIDLYCNDRHIVSKETEAMIVDELERHSQSCVPYCSLFDCIEVCRNKLEDTLTDGVNTPSHSNTGDPTCNLGQSDQWFGSLVKVDHMRNEGMYLKTLRSLSNRHGLRVTMINCGPHAIYIQVLSRVDVGRGEKPSIDAFMKDWRTVCVDVDSRGRPCKERMLTVLQQTTRVSNLSFTEQTCPQRFLHVTSASEKELEKFVVNELLIQQK